MISVREVPFDDATARSLWDAQQAELLERYGEPDLDSHLEPDGVIASFVGERDGEPVAAALVRWAPYDVEPGTVEVKRLYVTPEHRGHGHSRVMMGAAEAAARRAGATRVVIETGVKQPEAIALYRAIGYSDIPGYGTYKDHPDSVCMALELPTRVLVINGTTGAGKTSVAAAIANELTQHGVRHAWMDADYLCQAMPAPDGDRFQQQLLFDALRGAAPAFRRRGFGIVVIARVVEDGADRDRYAHAWTSRGGPAEVTIVRLAVPEDVRIARLAERERDSTPEWQRWHAERTVELEASLEDLALDDAVVANAGRDKRATARAVLDELGW